MASCGSICSMKGGKHASPRLASSVLTIETSPPDPTRCDNSTPVVSSHRDSPARICSCQPIETFH